MDRNEMKEAVGERAGDSWVLPGEDPALAPEDPPPAAPASALFSSARFESFP